MSLENMLQQTSKISFKTLWGALYQYGSLRSTPSLTPEEQEYLNSLGAKRCKRGFCYMNAQKIAVDDSYMKNPRLKYFEGLVTVYGIPIDHAWVEINGKVADPTPINPKKKFTPEYWGVEIPAKDVMKHMLKTKLYSPVTQDRYGKKLGKARGLSRVQELQKIS